MGQRGRKLWVSGSLLLDTEFLWTVPTAHFPRKDETCACLVGVQGREEERGYDTTKDGKRRRRLRTQRNQNVSGSLASRGPNLRQQTSNESNDSRSEGQIKGEKEKKWEGEGRGGISH